MTEENILPENKEGGSSVPLVAQNNKSAKEGSFMPLILIMIASMLIAFYWDKLPWISNSIHTIFDPSAGALIDWNLNLGMILIVFVITLLTTLVQKYATDQKTLKELKTEQKEIQKQMKEFKNHPEKVMELQKKQFAMMPKQMKLSMRAIAYTGIPFILFFRWFNDYFIAAGNPKFFGFLGWFWFYFLFAIIFGSILRKYLDVV
ncbi:MAG: EMC3/TMCO1 family protein [Candidatus Diapherotrites archaeon]